MQSYACVGYIGSHCLAHSHSFAGSRLITSCSGLGPQPKCACTPALHSKARMDAHSESTAHRLHPRLPHEPRYESNCSIAPSASPQALRDRAAGEDLFPARTGTRAHQALQRPLLTPVCNPAATLSPAQNRLVCIPRPSRVLDCCITLGVSGCPCQGAPKARRMASAAAQQPSMSAAPMIPGQNVGTPLYALSASAASSRCRNDRDSLLSLQQRPFRTSMVACWTLFHLIYPPTPSLAKATKPSGPKAHSPFWQLSLRKLAAPCSTAVVAWGAA